MCVTFFFTAGWNSLIKKKEEKKSSYNLLDPSTEKDESVNNWKKKSIKKG